MKLNREQIVKALECCIKVGGYRMGEHCRANCPLFDTRCALLLPQNALSLINELTVELDAMRCAANSYKMHYEKLTEENERLRADNAIEFTCVFDQPHKVSDCPINDEISKAKAKTVRKMQERLKANRVRRDGLLFKVVDFEVIDRVAAEMLDGE